jgi:hypothetical protein
MALRWDILYAGLLSNLAAPGLAAEPQPGAADTPAEIVVTGRTAHAVAAFADKLANADPDRQVARWNDPVCLRVSGIAPQYVEMIVARFRAVATSLKVRMVEGKCTANLSIRLTDDADALIRGLLGRGSAYIGNPDDAVLLDAKFKAGLLVPRPIRWFGATNTINADGTRMAYDDSGRHKIYTASLIAKNAKESLTATMVIIDTGRIDRVTMRQLADYLTLVSLSRPDLAADYAKTDSILALFAVPRDRAPVGMTLQDFAFLKALYAGSGARTVRQQRAAVRREIHKGSASGE